jgi:hypothetical protein
LVRLTVDGLGTAEPGLMHLYALSKNWGSPVTDEQDFDNWVFKIEEESGRPYWKVMDHFSTFIAGVETERKREVDYGPVEDLIKRLRARQGYEMDEHPERDWELLRDAADATEREHRDAVTTQTAWNHDVESMSHFAQRQIDTLREQLEKTEKRLERIKTDTYVTQMTPDPNGSPAYVLGEDAENALYHPGRDPL